MKLRCRDRLLDLDRAVVMGILNVTPDSFSDGGRWTDRDAAVQRGLQMVADGAGIVDVGGESTRPDATPVPEVEELARVLPVIETLAAEISAPISIDTRKAAVARRALEAGAVIVNDESGASRHGAMDRVVVESGAGVIVMHTRGDPRTMRSLTDYSDLVANVRSWLARRAGELERAGVPPDAIVLDPGFGFAKSAAQSLELLKRMDKIADLGYPLLAGTSRKSFIGAALGVEVEDRLEGTAATVAWAVAHGARIVRVHDVAAMARVVRMSEAIARAPETDV
ncbi:dihydropteroate synthase [soil metagenome]